MREYPRKIQGVLAVALVSSYVVAVGGAWAGSVALTLTAAVLTLVWEYLAWRHSTLLTQFLRRLGFSTGTRHLVRDVAIGVLLIRVLGPEPDQIAEFAGAIAALHLCASLRGALIVFTEGRRELPMVTRNVDLTALQIPARAGLAGRSTGCRCST